MARLKAAPKALSEWCPSICVTRTSAEIEAYADAMADVFRAYLEGLGAR